MRRRLKLRGCARFIQVFILTRAFGALSVAYVGLIHVDELSLGFGLLRKKIHHEQVHIAIFEHMRELLVDKPELLIERIVCNLNHKHRQSPSGTLLP